MRGKLNHFHLRGRREMVGDLPGGALEAPGPLGNSPPTKLEIQCEASVYYEFNGDGGLSGLPLWSWGSPGLTG